MTNVKGGILRSVSDSSRSTFYRPSIPAHPPSMKRVEVKADPHAFLTLLHVLWSLHDGLPLVVNPGMTRTFSVILATRGDCVERGGGCRAYSSLL